MFRSVQHYLNHIPYIIEKDGPLRAYSARSMERAIGKYASAIKSKVSSAANANNVVENFGVRSYIKSIIDINEIIDPIIPKQYTTATYLNHPDGLKSQLWEPFASNCLYPNEKLIEQVPVKSILKSLKKYYGRSKSIPYTQIRISYNEIKLAGRYWEENNLYSSLFDRRKKK